LIVELLWETGCRIGELTSLKVKDIQFDQYSAIVYLSGKTVCQQSDCKAENSPMAIYCQKCGHPLASDSTENLLKDPKFIAGLV
jgi:Zn finger protein HypA/HybF involved in hydrogenase expression